MDRLLLEYLPILIFIGLALVIGIALLLAPVLPAPSKRSKSSPRMNAASMRSAMRA